MDSYTLVIVSALASTIMAATMYLLHRASRRTPCLLDWSAAGLCFLASNAIALLAMHQPLPFVVAPGIANALYIGGHYLILAGVRRHLGLRPRYDWLAALAIFIVLLHASGFADGAVSRRLMLLSPFVVAINASVVWLLGRQPDSPARGSYLPLIMVEAAFMGQMAARGLFLALGQPMQLTFLGNQILQTAGSLMVLAFLSLSTMCCALIVIRHQELALRSASLTDSLTGWLNRRALLDMAEREFQRQRRSGEALNFLTFDIDHFKRINDQYGHAVGDAAIRHVTAVSAQALRGYDARFRIGGEEFAVLVTGEGNYQARQIGERLRTLIENSPLLVDGQGLTLTVSLGVAGCQPDDLQWDDALRRADQALYHAKRHGRNRLSVWGEDLLPAATARLA